MGSKRDARAMARERKRDAGRREKSGRARERQGGLTRQETGTKAIVEVGRVGGLRGRQQSSGTGLSSKGWPGQEEGPYRGLGEGQGCGWGSAGGGRSARALFRPPTPMRRNQSRADAGTSTRVRPISVQPRASGSRTRGCTSCLDLSQSDLSRVRRGRATRDIAAGAAHGRAGSSSMSERPADATRARRDVSGPSGQRRIPLSSRRAASKLVQQGSSRVGGSARPAARVSLGQQQDLCARSSPGVNAGCAEKEDSQPAARSRLDDHVDDPAQRLSRERRRGRDRRRLHDTKQHESTR